jgi:hypothetical protein
MVLSGDERYPVIASLRITCAPQSVRHSCGDRPLRQVEVQYLWPGLRDGPGPGPQIRPCQLHDDGRCWEGPERNLGMCRECLEEQIRDSGRWRRR